MTNEYPIPSPAGQPILIHAIRHIRRMHMNCRTWTLPQGDEKAVNLLLNVYHGYLTGYESVKQPVCPTCENPANDPKESRVGLNEYKTCEDKLHEPEFDRNYPDDELPTCPDCGGAGHSRCEPQYPEPEFDRINHGPLEHPVS